MKITDLRAYVVRAQEARPWMFVEIDTDEGITGYGESTNVGGGGAIVIAQTYALLTIVRTLKQFSDRMVRHSRVRGQNYSRQEEVGPLTISLIIKGLSAFIA